MVWLLPCVQGPLSLCVSLRREPVATSPSGRVWGSDKPLRPLPNQQVLLGGASSRLVTVRPGLLQSQVSDAKTLENGRENAYFASLLKPRHLSLITALLGKLVGL